MAQLKRHLHHDFAEKKLMLEKFLLSSEYKDVSPKDFSEICKVNYCTFLRWGRAIEWDPMRIEELKRKSRKKTQKTQSGLGEGVEAKILAIKGKHRNWGPLKIKQYLWRQEQILVPQTSIYKFLKGRGLVNERKEAEEKVGHNRGFEYDTPMAGVQMDLMHLTLSNGEAIYLVTLLDDHSRFVLLSRFIPVKTMDEVTDVFKEAVRTYGVMGNLLTDCGAEFVSWQRFTKFEELLVNLDVGYIASGPDKKENQGKLERWHQTVREALRMRGPMDYSSEAQLWIRDLVNFYNYERPHQGIGGLFPADRFFGMREEIETELGCYRAGKRVNQQIYMVCRVGDRKLVVSGERPDELDVRFDGKALGAGSLKTDEIQLEKKSVEDVGTEDDAEVGNNA